MSSATLRLSNQLAELERASRWLEEFGRREGLPPRMIFEVNLALDEILTNVISYGYEPGETHGIVVELTLLPQTLRVEVEDDGRPFNPIDVPEPDFDKPVAERPIGGLGVHLVRQVMDKVEYRRVEGRNRLTMTKSTTPTSPTGD
jgi:anti-sigma regulatory factor (Ser/Thr protein kinase)